MSEGEYPVLKWTEQTPAIVTGGKPFFLKKRNFKATKNERERPVRERKERALLSRGGAETISFPYDESLFESLRQLRLQIAREEAVPPYVVFSDRALQEMATHFPQTEQEFSKINGVGPIKWMKYGQKFLDAIGLHGGKRGVQEKEKIAPRSSPSRSSFSRNDSIKETVALYHQRYPIEEIATARQLTSNTILGHLADAIQRGQNLDLSQIIPEERQAAIKQVIGEVGAERLNPIKEKLPPEVTFEEIRLVAAFFRREVLDES